MTLMISAQRFDGECWVDLALDSDLAGLENTRRTFYSSDLTMSLGLRLLPQLRLANLFVVGDELIELRAEVTTLLAAIIGRTDEQYWVERLNNIAKAVELVIGYGADGAVAIG
jgi:hypothetical protein